MYFKGLCKFLLAFLTVMTPLVSSQSLSQTIEEQILDPSDIDDSLRWFPGEQYDLLTGKITHSMVDLEVVGNGLPIVIRRVFGGRGVDEWVNWHIDVPKLNMTDDYFHGRLVFTSGNRSIHLLSRDNWVSSHSYPDQADYASADNWIAQKIKQGKTTVFKVFSPDGTVYNLNEITGRETDNRPIVARATSVEDRNGNRLVYAYVTAASNPSGDRNKPRMLTSITSFEGSSTTFDTKVTFHRTEEVIWDEDHWQGTGVHRISKIVSNTSQDVNYEFVINEQNDYLKSFPSAKDSTLKKVHYGYSNTVEYTYNRSGIKTIKYPEGAFVAYDC